MFWLAGNTFLLLLPLYNGPVSEHVLIMDTSSCPKRLFYLPIVDTRWNKSTINFIFIACYPTISYIFPIFGHPLPFWLTLSGFPVYVVYKDWFIDMRTEFNYLIFKNYCIFTIYAHNVKVYFDFELILFEIFGTFLKRTPPNSGQ